MYILGHRPYKDKFFEKFEIFNEYIILACSVLNHLNLVELAGNSITDIEDFIRMSKMTVKCRFYLGLTEMALIGINILINLACVAYFSLLDLWMIVKKCYKFLKEWYRENEIDESR